MWLSLPNMRERWGAEGALAVARAAEDAVAGIGDFCEAEGVDAWFRRGGYLKVSTAAAFDDVEPRGASPPAASWARRMRRGAERGGGRRALPLAGLPRRRLLPRRGHGAAGPARARPARAAARRRGRGLRVLADAEPEAAPERGRGAHRRRRGPAGGAVLATGGAAKGLRGPLRGRLSIASSHIVITEPVPELLEEIGWTGGECITDSRALVDYFRTTPDGRIAFGWGGGRISLGAGLEGRAELDREVIDQTIGHLQRLLPRAGGEEGHPRLGRADRRLADPPAAGPAAARRPRLRRRRLHRQRRRPLAHGRPHARLAGARPPRRTLAPRLRRPLAAPRPARALPLDRRRSDPPRDHGQGGGPARRPRARAGSPPPSPACPS